MKSKKNLFLLFIFLPCLVMGQWEIQSTAFPDSLRALEHIWAVDHQIAWAIAKDGSGNGAIIQEFTRTTDGGQNWSPGIIGGVSGWTPTSLFALNADTAWVLLYNPSTDGGKVMRTNDAGNSWVHQSTALFVDSLEAYPNLIYFWDENNGFCAGDATNGFFEIYTTSDGGNLWSRVPSNNMPALISGEYGYATYFSVVGNSVWFGTSKGSLYYSSNRGYHWTGIPNPLLNNGKIRVVQFRDTLNGIIGNRSGNTFSLYRTSDGGSSWSALSPSGNVYGRSLSYAPGTPGTLISTSNASAMSGSSISYDFGDNWTDIPNSAGMELTCLGNFKDQTVWGGMKNTDSITGGIARYKIPSYDAGISSLIAPLSPCEGDHDILVELTNYGYGRLDSVEVHWKFNGVGQLAVVHQSVLSSGESVVLNLGTHYFGGGNTESLTLYTHSPNGMQDTLPANDTLNQQILVHSLPVVFLGNDTTAVVDSIYLDAGAGYASYLWSTGDTTQTLFPLALGMNLYWVEVTDSNGCMARDSIVVTTYLNTGTEENETTNSFQLYPNPCRGEVSLLPLPEEDIRMDVFDTGGRTIWSKRVNPHSIDLSELHNGIYWVRILVNDQCFYRKIILEK